MAKPKADFSNRLHDLAAESSGLGFAHRYVTRRLTEALDEFYLAMHRAKHEKTGKKADLVYTEKEDDHVAKVKAKQFRLAPRR